MFFSQVAGALCGAALGAIRTGDAALHLLEKNKALHSSGIVSLPGQGHWETMASWKPAGAGALFFGLSLGLGFGTLFALWIKCSAHAPGRAKKILPWTPLSMPLWALWCGDPLLAVMFLVLLLTIIFLHSLQGDRPQNSKNLLLPLACLAIISLGLWPWATANEGPFTRMRDKLFLGSDIGLGVNTFYYKWTFYPAEVLKPIANKSQPAAIFAPGLSDDFKSDFCKQIDKFGGVCLFGDEDVGDFLVLSTEGGGYAVQAGETIVPWFSDSKTQKESWTVLSNGSYRYGAMRSATAWALIGGFFHSNLPKPFRYASILLGGCPLALIAALMGAVMWLGQRLSFGNILPALLFSVLLALGLAFSGSKNNGFEEVKNRFNDSPTPSMDEVQDIFQGGDNVVRFYTTREMRRYGNRAVPLLVQALSDPVINIRYAACESLGATDILKAKVALENLLASDEDWYVKDRAYFALRRLGWRPN